MVSTRHSGYDYAPVRYTRNSSAAASADLEAAGASSSSSQEYVSTTNFMDLPSELILKITEYLPFKKVCQLRLVCRSMDQICAHRLNSTFQRLQTQMLNKFQQIKSKMPRRESARRNHHLACESDIIETLHMRLTLLQMSFGKHIERKHCCFFPGEILDEVYNILHYIKVTPKLGRPYKVTDELFDLSTMAMEYFKEKIEPELPEIAYFSTKFLDFSGGFPSSSSKYLVLDSSPLSPEDESKGTGPSHDALDNEDAEPIPQSNMVLRKRIRKIKQGMKRYNSQLTILRQDLKSCKRKTAEQQKQITEQQKQLAEQQKQTLEYATRLDEYDKKNEEISRKFSTLLQELNKCKTELQYWRSKSPATPPFCNGCGSVIQLPSEELQALMNQGVHINAEGEELEPPKEFLPIAGPSTDQQHNKKDLVEETVKSEAPVSPSSKSIKRKLEEPTETPTSAPKSRRVSKVRSKKVNKL